MSWIKMRTDLYHDPRVVRIASACDADRCRIIGALYMVWCVADAHTVDGKLTGYTGTVIDELVGIDGFAKAVASVGWLVVESQTVTVPKFEKHNGRSAKRRASEAKRKQEGRNASACDADEKRSREEEEKKKKQIPASAGKSGRAFKKPTVEQVEHFASEQGFALDAQAFVDHYQANGWRVGKASMKCWEAAARSWARREPDFRRKGQAIGYDRDAVLTEADQKLQEALNGSY